MKVNLINIETEKTTSEDLQDEFFGLDPRKDILHRVVTWQLSRKRLGTRKTKSRGEITGSTKKIMRQKGSGGARHRTKKVNLFRGGGTAFGPKVRDHSTKLPVAMDFERAFIVFSLILIMCMGSSFIAMKRLVDADPAEIF